MVWTEAPVWAKAAGQPPLPIPVATASFPDSTRDLKRIVFCRDAETGSLVYQGRLGAVGDYYSSPEAGDGKVYIASADGVVIVLEVGDVLNVLARNDPAESIMATPALVWGNVYVRTSGHLYAVGN